uniref:Uncharacterized protein n=1 Tax=Pyrodinium bahamense TaxID=73915 RepID=A0A7R9ZYT5_9DINO|mmetsp:Transcript_15530/g.42909  ORF Transcript_15530/g.42909 Transcript_15530/m.42909 type:complete len:355 (+) Transcript_15530:106-1170(+)
MSSTQQQGMREDWSLQGAREVVWTFKPAAAPVASVGCLGARRVTKWAVVLLAACIGTAGVGTLVARQRVGAPARVEAPPPEPSASALQEAPPPQFSELPAIPTSMLTSLRTAVGGGGRDLEFSAYISWRRHPSKCLDCSHRRIEHWAPHAGMPLQLLDCLEEPDLFLLPLQGTGAIKLNGYEGLCLDAPELTHLQFWDCMEAPSMNLRFVLDESATTGSFRFDAPRGMCLDVPNSSPKNGNRLQVWPCTREKAGDETFDIHVPIDCKWEQVGEWGSCSEVCGGGHQGRPRHRVYGAHLRNATTGESNFYVLKEFSSAQWHGKDCQGDNFQLRSCNTQECPVKDATWFWSLSDNS